MGRRTLFPSVAFLFFPHTFLFFSPSTLVKARPTSESRRFAYCAFASWDVSALQEYHENASEEPSFAFTMEFGWSGMLVQPSCTVLICAACMFNSKILAGAAWNPDRLSRILYHVTSVDGKTLK
jgi:hypothetical protein